jgi:hypothetical protein
MTKHYEDYFWKEGIPYGIRHVENPLNFENETYKIVMDPYRKFISVEKYFKQDFVRIIYDSKLLNFRFLKTEDTRAWQKIITEETSNKVVCQLRDHDDRLVFIETHLFDNSLCRKCDVKSPHDIAISTQRMYYKLLQDPFDGVILFDSENKPVCFKEYEFDENLNEFTNLICAKWDMKDYKI